MTFHRPPTGLPLTSHRPSAAFHQVARLEKMLLEDRELRDSLSSALLEPGGHEGSAESFGNEHFSA